MARGARTPGRAVLDRLRAARFSRPAGIDTVMYGVDGPGAHATDEWIDLWLAVVTATLERAIARYAG